MHMWKMALIGRGASLGSMVSRESPFDAGAATTAPRVTRDPGSSGHSPIPAASQPSGTT